LSWANYFNLKDKDFHSPNSSKFSAAVAAKKITELWLSAKFVTPMNDQGGDVIWRYDPNIGIYKPDGIPVIEQTVKDVMRDKTRSGWLSETVKLCKVETYTDPDKFEAVKDFIVVENGTLEIFTRALHKHSWGYNQKQAIPVKFDEKQDCPAIKRFLEEVCPGELDVFQEWFGYHLLKDYRFQKAFIFTGKGANGKSTLFSLLDRFLGNENISNQSLYDLTSNRFSVAELYEKLANVSPDVGSDELKRTGTFKALTGGDSVKAERKNRDPFSFKNYAKLNFACNQLPTSPDESDAFFRRFMVFEFNNIFDEKTADPNIISKLTTPEELSGLLNFALEGLERLLERGYFKQIKSTEEMRKYYRELASPELAFVTNCVEENSDGMITKDQMYNAYNCYCKMRGFVTQAKNMFSQELGKHIYLQQGQQTIDGDRVRVWKGADLLCGFSDSCTGCTGYTGFSFSVLQKNYKEGLEMPVQPMQPVQDGLIKVGLQSQLKDLFTIIFEVEHISEYELVDQHGYKHESLKSLLQVLARDNMIFTLRPGVWSAI